MGGRLYAGGPLGDDWLTSKKGAKVRKGTNPAENQFLGILSQIPNYKFVSDGACQITKSYL